MKTQLNSLAWIGILISLLACLSFTSCKKENEVTPITPQKNITNSTPPSNRYIFESMYTNGNENYDAIRATLYDTIYLVNDTTITSPLAAGHQYNDTIIANLNDEFDQQITNTSTYYAGFWTEGIYQGKATITLTYNWYSGTPYTEANKIYPYAQIVYMNK